MRGTPVRVAVAAVAAVVAMVVAVPAQAATFPGLNGAIAYQKMLFEPNSTEEIFRIDPDGTDDVRMTMNAVGDYAPKWSPDGTRVTFARCISSGGCISRVWLMNADGSGARTLTDGNGDGTASDAGPVWSPDGTRIAYTITDNFTELWIENANGTGPRKLASSSGFGGIADQVFAPNGRTIAFARVVGSGLGVWTIGANGTGMKQVAPAGAHAPVWSPDGSKIAYQSGGELWLVNADGTNPNNLTATPAPLLETNAIFTVDGAALVFSRMDPSPSPPTGDVIRLDLTSGVETNLTPDTPATLEAANALSPDGTKLVGVAPASGVFVMDIDGSDIVPLQPGVAPDWQPLCTIQGTAAAETLTGSEGPDVICGAGGNDLVRGGAGNDVIFGGAGNDRLLGGEGIDKLVGQAGNDVLVPGAGDDLVVGDVGIDVLSYAAAAASITLSLANGTARGEGSDALVSIEHVTGSARNDSFTGSSGANTLTGGGGSDVLRGGGGTDRLLGGSGNDRLFGEAGNDQLSGQGGNDLLNGGSGRDTCAQGAGSGTRRGCER